MIYQKTQQKPNCEELNAAYDRILEKHHQRIRRYFNPSIINQNRNQSILRIKLEKQFANTLFNICNQGKMLTFEDLQKIEPFLFVQLCSDVEIMLKNVRKQRKRSFNASAFSNYFSLQKKKQAKRIFSQRKIKRAQQKLFEEKQLKEIEQKLNKIIKQRTYSCSFFSLNFMKIFQKKAQIVRKISNARRESKYEQGFKCYQRAQKAIQDIRTRKDYIMPHQISFRFRQDINNFLIKGIELISFLGNRLKQLIDESKETKIPKQQLFSMEVIMEGLQKARIKVLSSIQKIFDSCVYRVREYYESQFKNQIPLKELDYLATHFESQVEYIAIFVNKELSSISKQFINLKSFNPNITSKLVQAILQLENKQSQRLLIKIENNFSRSYEYISKLFDHIKQVSMLQNLLMPLPQAYKQISKDSFGSKRANRNQRIS